MVTPTNSADNTNTWRSTCRVLLSNFYSFNGQTYQDFNDVRGKNQELKQTYPKIDFPPCMVKVLMNLICALKQAHPRQLTNKPTTNKQKSQTFLFCRVRKPTNPKNTWLSFAGSEVAQYCSKFLPDCIKETDQYKEGQLGPALVDAFLKFDSTLVQDEIIKELKLLAGVDENDEEEEGTWQFVYWI